MENNCLTKDQASELVNVIKFLTKLEMGNMKFKSYTAGDDFITWKKDGSDIKIKFGDLLIKSNKNETKVETKVEKKADTKEVMDDITSTVGPEQLGGGFLSDTSSIMYSDKKKISKNMYSDMYSVTSANSVNNMTGGGFSETSDMPVLHKSSKSSSSKHKNNFNSDVYSVTSPNPKFNSMKGSMKGGNLGGSLGGGFSETSSYNFMSNFSETSMVNQSLNNLNSMNGGGLSETSSYNFMSNFSETSVFNQGMNNLGNMNGGGFSDTSAMVEGNGIAYSQTSSYDPKFTLKGGSKSKLNNLNAMSDIFSPTSALTMKGGNKGRISHVDTAGLTDTLDLSTDLKLSESLDTNIFKKPAQKGGSVSSRNELKNKMKEMGIGSTSTSSICE